MICFNMSSPPIRKIESVQNINIVIYINKNGEVEVDFKGRLCLAGTGILNFVFTLHKVLLLLAANTFFGTQTKSRCPCFILRSSKFGYIFSL